jgi:hypothetical protein
MPTCNATSVTDTPAESGLLSDLGAARSTERDTHLFTAQT